MLTEDFKWIQSKIVAVLIFNQVYWFWSFLASDPLLTNWLPWQQRNGNLWNSKFSKYLFGKSYQVSIKLMACSISEFGVIYWAEVGKHSSLLPGAYRVIYWAEVAYIRAKIHTVLREIKCRGIIIYCSDTIKYCTFLSKLAASERRK